MVISIKPKLRRFAIVLLAASALNQDVRDTEKFGKFTYNEKEYDYLAYMFAKFYSEELGLMKVTEADTAANASTNQIYCGLLAYKVMRDSKKAANIFGTAYEAPTAVGRRVLLAEDNKLNREIAHHVLEEEGIVVEDAKDGLVALDMFKLNGYDYYDLIFMDIQMPNMDGYEATRAIRQYEEEMGFKHRVPIIAMTL